MFRQSKKDDSLAGFRFLDETDKILLKFGKYGGPVVEFKLEDGERILGIKSKLRQHSVQDLSMNHSDL